jgi:oligoendopeptidase F
MSKKTQKQPSWDLSDLYQSLSDKNIKRDLKQALSKATAFKKTYKGKISKLSSKNLCKAYQEFEAIISLVYRPSQYAHLVYSIDTSCNKAKALMSEIDEEETTISNELVFFDLELSKIDSKTFDKHMKSIDLENYHYNIQRSKDTAKFNLEENEEQMANLKDITGENAHKKLYDELTSSFEFEFTFDGKKQTINGDQLRSLRHHKNKNTRRKAMKLFFDHYKDNKIVLSHLYNQIVKDHNLERKKRGYNSPIAVRNAENDLTDKTIKVLHETTTESYPLVHRYYELKKKILKLPDMTLADIYAPIPSCSKEYTWKEAKDIVLDAFSQFDEEIYKYAKIMFDENRIDAPVKKNKTGGAYCSSSTPNLNPYVMLNFQGKPRDVATLAHELGHAIHDMLCSKQTLFNYHPILPLAETASIFSEMIVTDMLLKNETDKKLKISLISNKLEDIFASSHRQNMFSRFEINSHEKITNSLMSPEELCELYKSELKLMFGKSVTITDEYAWEWATIPHIYSWPFYVYAYNFANLSVIALYQTYLEEGKAIIPKYKEFLSLGSSKDPIHITQVVGANITSKKFWDKSFNYIETLVDQLEELL